MRTHFVRSGFIVVCILFGWGMVYSAIVVAQPSHSAERTLKTEVDDMAYPRWIATADASWASTTSWSTGAVPIDGDSVRFDDTANGNVIAGLDQTGVALARLDVVGYRGNIGSYASPLILSAGTIVDRGHGACHLASDALTGSVVINKPSLASESTLRGYWSRCCVLAGRLAVTNVLTANAHLMLLGGKAVVRFVYSGASQALKMIVVRWGDLDMAAHADTLQVYGGNVTIREAIDINYLYNDGGTIDYRPTVVSGDQLIGLRGGTTDFRNCQTQLSLPNVIIGPEAIIRVSPLVTLGSTFLLDLREDFP